MPTFPPIRLTEVDGSPNGIALKLVFPNGTLSKNGTTWTYTPAGGSGLGDVVGPGSATDNAIVRFDGTTGKLVQNSVVTINDTTGAINGFKDRGGQVFNVKAYGAVGDGSTNDAVAIQAAIDAAVAVRGRVYFPHGIYAFGTALSLNSATSVVLEGESGIVWPSPVTNISGSVLKWTGTGSGSAITAAGSTGVVFHDLGIYYSSGSFTGTLINLSTAVFTVIERCHVANYPSSGVLSAKALVSTNLAVGPVIRDSSFSGAQWAIRGFETGSGIANAVSIINCVFDTCSSAFIGNIGFQWVIDRCTFEFEANGLVSTPSAIDSDITCTSDFRLVNSAFWDTSDVAQIPIRQRVGNTWTKALIDGNMFDIFAATHILCDGPGNVTITNNQFTATLPAQATTLVDLGSSATAKKTSAVISGNRWFATSATTVIANVSGHDAVQIFGNDATGVLSDKIDLLGSLVFRNLTNSNLLTIKAGATGSNLTFTLPTADGSSGQPLTTNASGVLSFGVLGAAGGGTGNSSYTKGDILVATAATTLAKLGVGADTQVLTADSSTASGLKWAAAGGSGGTTINATNGAVPYRVDASTFADSPIVRNGATSITVGASLRIQPGVASSAEWYNSNGLYVWRNGADSLNAAFLANGELRLPSSAGAINFSSTTDATGSPDLGLTRISSGLLGVGDSSAGSFAGNLKLTVLNAVTGIQINGAATSRKMLVGNGTNFIASTETWAVPGTSGNVLTSDGTNWTSAAPAGGGTTINATNGVVPYRSSSTVFLDSPITVSVPGSMVDGITITGAATASPAFVQIAATGSDSVIKIALINKGTNSGIAIGGVTSSFPMLVPLANGDLRLVNATFGAGTDFYANALYSPNDTTPTSRIDSNGLTVVSSGAVRFSSSSSSLNSQDSGLYRQGVGILQFGTGSANASGSWLATNGTLSGNLIVNGSTSVIRLKGYTVATLPAGTAGDTAYVTDAVAPTFLTALTGGGSTVAPVFYNGTAWVSY